MLETPAGQSPRFRQVEGFSALSMAGGFLARPAGCWKGGKAAPSPRFRIAPYLHAARRTAPEKPKKKGTLPDALAPLPTELLPIAVMVC